MVVHVGGRGRVYGRVVGIICGWRVRGGIVRVVSIFVGGWALGELAASKVEHAQDGRVRGVCLGEALTRAIGWIGT
jgi:hypothetical protein